MFGVILSRCPMFICRIDIISSYTAVVGELLNLLLALADAPANLWFIISRSSISFMCARCSLLCASLLWLTSRYLGLYPAALRANSATVPVPEHPCSANATSWSNPKNDEKTMTNVQKIAHTAIKNPGFGRETTIEEKHPTATQICKNLTEACLVTRYYIILWYYYNIILSHYYIEYCIFIIWLFLLVILL